MNITSKSRYALKIMMDLAHHRAEPLVRRNDIAKRQGIPTDYLDQIMIRLRAGNLVKSTRGRSGGYCLARDPADISMWDLFSAVEETMVPVQCISNPDLCDFDSSCVSKKAWVDIFSALKGSLGGISLESLASKWSKDLEMTFALGEVRECASGGSAKTISSRIAPTPKIDGAMSSGTTHG